MIELCGGNASRTTRQLLCPSFFPSSERESANTFADRSTYAREAINLTYVANMLEILNNVVDGTITLWIAAYCEGSVPAQLEELYLAAE